MVARWFPFNGFVMTLECGDDGKLYFAHLDDPDMPLASLDSLIIMALRSTPVIYLRNRENNITLYRELLRLQRRGTVVGDREAWWLATP